MGYAILITDYDISGAGLLGVQALTAAILTEGGELRIFFYDGVGAINFAKALTMTPIREKLMKTPVLPWSEDIIGDKLDDTELKYFPMMRGERVRASLKSSSHYTIADFAPYCHEKNLLQCYNKCCRQCLLSQPPVLNICSKESCGCCFPWLPYVVTCCLRPFIQEEFMVVTDTAVFSYSSKRNYGLCGFRPTNEIQCCIGPFAKIGDFHVAWAPLGDLRGHDYFVGGYGKENCCRRCCKDWICGKICCPLGQ